MLKNIPSQYRAEFIKRGASLLKKRVKLLCILTVGIYLFVDAVSFLIDGASVRKEELPLMAILLLATWVILILNKRANTLAAARANALLFSAMVFFLIIRVNILYPEYAVQGLSVYIFLLFFICFVIPWAPSDVVYVTLMCTASFTAFFLYVKKYFTGLNTPFTLANYMGSIIFILMSFIIIFVVRRKELKSLMQNFILLKDVESKNIQMERELDLATKIHKTLIPKSISTDLVDIAVMYLPAYYLGGDYAKFHFIDKDRLIFIICDVTGHGVSAALLVNRLHTEFERLALQDEEPGQLLNNLNDFIMREFEGTNMYLSAFCGILNFRDKKFNYSNHGHPAQYLYQLKQSKIVQFSSQAALLGLAVEPEGIVQRQIDFDRGDKILLFTDGIIEAMDKDGHEYGRDRVEAFIGKNGSLQVGLFNQKLIDELNNFTGRKFNDDVFLLTMEVR